MTSYGLFEYSTRLPGLVGGYGFGGEGMGFVGYVHMQLYHIKREEIQ